MPKISPLAEKKVSAGAFDIWHKANQMQQRGIDVIRLEIGEPDYPTPPHIVEAAERAMRAGRTGYDAANGTIGLRTAIANYLSRTRKMTANAGQVSVSPGVKGTLFTSIMTTVPRGGEMLVPDPGYPMYQSIMAYVDGVSVPYPLRPENRFEPDPAEIEKLITPKTAAILINSPSNPTGTLISPEVMGKIAEIAVKYDLWVLSDEVYAQIYFGDEFPVSPISFPGMAERTILMDGCSKAYNMTGWRVGFGYYPKELLSPVAQLVVHTHSSLPPFIMDAAEVAFNGPQDCVAEMVQVYKERAAVVCDKLESVPGISAIRPDGAFYVMVDVSKIAGKDDRAAAEKVLENGVAILPGSGMGKQSEGFFRISLTQPADVISTAIDRIVLALK
ncbi:MAG: aspartate aminotransferase [Candidatus Promineifilaceae bacterium]|jgi:aspartate aminotransferase